MSRSAFGKKQCYVCGQWVSAAGFAWVSHCRKHVREGYLEEKHSMHERFPGIRFMRTDKSYHDEECKK